MFAIWCEPLYCIECGIFWSLLLLLEWHVFHFVMHLNRAQFRLESSGIWWKDNLIGTGGVSKGVLLRDFSCLLRDFSWSQVLRVQLVSVVQSEIKRYRL